MPPTVIHIPVEETHHWLYFYSHIYLLSINYAKVVVETQLVTFYLPLCYLFLLAN